MLTQHDAMILAGMPIRDGSTGPRERPEGRAGASNDDHRSKEIERPSRLDILLEPLSQVVTAIRARLGTGKSSDPKTPLSAP